MSDELHIDEITLINYRQYYGTIKIRFPKKSSAFSVIIGGNGAGKSNLWNAIHWCLFGNEPHLKSRNTSIISNKYIKEQHKNKMAMSVQIVMASGNKKYRIRRQIEGLLHRLERDDDNILTISKEDPVPSGFEIIDRHKSTLFQISENGGVFNTESNRHDFNGLIRRLIIPENLSYFFVLDGEFLQELFDRLREIKSGINQISQINILNDTLSMVETARFPKLKKIGRDEEQIEAAIERHEQYLRSEDHRGIVQKSSTMNIYGAEDMMHATGRPRINDLEISIRNIDARLRQIEKAMTESNAEVKMAIKDQYDEKHSRKKEIETHLADAEQSYRELIVHSGPFMLCKSSVERATDLIRSEMDKGNLPNSSKRMFVGDLLSKGSCLCGASLGDGTVARKNVENELAHISGDIQYDIADRIRFHNEKFLEEYDATVARIDRDIGNVQTYRMKIDKLKEEIDELESKMPEESEDYSRLIGERSALTREKELEQKELWTEENAIGKHSREHGDELRRLKTIKSLDAEGKKYRLLKEKSAIVQSTLRNITEHVTKNIREDVSKETLKIFNSLNWKKDYANLAIDSKYVIRVTREDGFDLAGSMSAGEKLFLALSFIMALKKITNYKFPFVIDSPLGKTAGDLRLRFGMHMPDLLDGSQLIMLATNSEYTRNKIELEDGSEAKDNLKALFQKKVDVHEYKIVHDKEAETSNIIKLGGKHVG